MAVTSTLKRYLWQESGLASLHCTGRDAYLIILTRTVRMIAYGGSSLILALFLSALNTNAGLEEAANDFRIGLFMTLTLAGDVVLSLLVTLVADKMIGRRRTVQYGGLLMIAAGIVFGLAENFWVLLIAAVVGVISVSGGDVGPFRAVEESMISEITTAETRADVLSWYVTMASFGSAGGSELAGRIMEWLHMEKGWTVIQSYQACFWLYTIMGGASWLASMFLSKECELQQETRVMGKDEAAEDLEGLLQDDEQEAQQTEIVMRESKLPPRPTKKNSRLARISSETRSVMYGLWILLMIDSLSDGMNNMSLVTLYMDFKFNKPGAPPGLSKSTLGDFLSVSYLLASLSTIFAAPLARHLGLVYTMVYTHVPSSLAVLLFPFPQSVWLTFVLLLVRVGLNNMDQAPRTALLAGIVRYPEERTAVMGITSTLRTLANVLGPSITGIMAGNDWFWLSFVIGGIFRLIYDVGLWVMFLNIKLHNHDASPKRSMTETSQEMDELDTPTQLDMPVIGSDHHTHPS